MLAFLNGEFLPAEQATVSIFDRGFLYGDALFETVRVHQGRPFLWERHAQRLADGAAALRIHLPDPPDTLLLALRELLTRNHLTNAIARITVSRGTGPRGYSIRGAQSPTVAIATFPAGPWDDHAPSPWRLHTARVRLPVGDPLTPFKTSSKLTHILARAEAEEAGCDEALVLNTSGHLAEASSANLFWIQGSRLITPPLRSGALAGITRGWILERAAQHGWQPTEESASPDALLAASGTFLTLSSLGIVEASHLDGVPLPTDPRVASLRAAYQTAIRDALKAERICD